MTGLQFLDAFGEVEEFECRFAASELSEDRHLGLAVDGRCAVDGDELVGSQLLQVGDTADRACLRDAMPGGVDDRIDARIASAPPDQLAKRWWVFVLAPGRAGLAFVDPLGACRDCPSGGPRL